MVIGACLAPRVNAVRLVATLLAFFLAVGVAAHALDELHGRPLRTKIPTSALVAVSVVGLAGAVTLGIAGVVQVGWVLIPFLVVGPLLVVGYNAELFGGLFHNDVTFGLAWGAFPVLTAYVAQTGRLAFAPLIAAAAAVTLSIAQRRLSTPARMLRRRTSGVHGSVAMADGSSVTLSQQVLLAPLEHALRAMSWSVVLLATALAIDRLT